MHLVKPIDLLVAAPDVHETEIVHYDHDYDILAEHTFLALGSVWAAPRGSVG